MSKQTNFDELPIDENLDYNSKGDLKSNFDRNWLCTSDMLYVLEVYGRFKLVEAERGSNVSPDKKSFYVNLMVESLAYPQENTINDVKYKETSNGIISQNSNGDKVYKIRVLALIDRYNYWKFFRPTIMNGIKKLHIPSGVLSNKSQKNATIDPILKFIRSTKESAD